VGNLVRDANTGCPQHDGAIGGEIFATCDMTLAIGDGDVGVVGGVYY
jgi:hypothetical protein